ncbi:hypothetical protein EYF80_032226 [Liparis tanakae]|uniref:Uncharacterized protein n=1 Tax=Liparis tanakae TaxID=230148 RepID=A0A4Z2GWD4_9TELE|nr:hypothetical protein EYF80_032226 [Liparis tanakae]
MVIFCTRPSPQSIAGPGCLTPPAAVSSSGAPPARRSARSTGGGELCLPGAGHARLKSMADWERKRGDESAAALEMITGRPTIQTCWTEHHQTGPGRRETRKPS